MFEILKSYGATFSLEFWGLLAKSILFPIFEDLQGPVMNINLQNSKFANQEELSIWLSTTLIQALHQLVDLFTYYFEILSFILCEFLSLLESCMLHKNESISRIGSVCLKQLILQNQSKLHDMHWQIIINFFKGHFEKTTPSFLYSTFPEESAPNETKGIKFFNYKV